MTPAGRRGADETAADFFAAIRDGDAEAVWAAFSEPARRFVVERGIRRGLSPAAGDALLDGAADQHFHDQFIEDVLAGLRKDLDRIRLEFVEFGEPVDDGSGRIKVMLLEGFDIPVGPPLEPLPVGSVVLVDENDNWKVDRLIPRPGG